MLIEQIIKFDLRWLRLLGRKYVLLQLVIIMTKQKFLSSGFLFTAKMLQKQHTLLFPTWAKSLTKFNLKMRDFKRVLDLTCKLKWD